MATARPRTAGLGAVRRQSMRVYNEPFTPNVVETDENEAHILRLQLPDFGQQHVKVKVEEESRMVVVTGDWILGNNRLLILDKTYPIPEFCVIDQIHHKLEAGFLTITMPKRTTTPAVETAAPPPLPLPPKELEQTTPAKENEQISPENAAPMPTEPEQTTPEKGSEEISPENAAPMTAEPEQTTPEKGSGEISPGNAASPATKAEITEEPEEDDKGKSKGLKKQASAKAEDKAPTPAPAVAPPPAAVDMGAGERDSGEAEMTPDEKISSPNQNPTEKKEIENENPEKGKESKAEEMGKSEETAKIGTGAGKLAGGFRVGRIPLPVMASLTAAVVTAVAAYFAFAYYGFPFAME